MKKILKFAAVIVGLIVAGFLMQYVMLALGCLMIFISETCNVPL